MLLIAPPPPPPVVETLENEEVEPLDPRTPDVFVPAPPAPTVTVYVQPTRLNLDSAEAPPPEFSPTTDER